MNKIREDLLNILLARSKPLQIRKELETLEFSQDRIKEDLARGIPTDENISEIRKWRTIFSKWDNAEGVWTENTLPRSEERRSLILKRLGIGDTILGEELSRKIPLNEPRIDIAVISSNSEHEDWVTGNRITDNGFWASYKKQLEQKKKWSDNAISSLDTSTTRILNHLKDPLSDKLGRVKGLVVGYIQSGKTANYSALIAKAVDTGYRLIIVLSGRTDILRNQTQARLDMELTGWDNLDQDEQENKYKSLSVHQNYKDKFVNYNGRQKFSRLTKTDKDFDPGSIAHALHDTGNPIIAVLKKIPKRLKKFAEILGKSEWKSKPVLLIDDESDDGSINTSKSDITKTAKLIAEILKASDASQYIGYTATPYANVFIRPDCVEELFPSDFVISLDRPEHYMGTLETFDIGDCEIDNSENIFVASNEKSFIRVIDEEIDEIENPLADLPKLPEAIDSFILAGAIKKWREKNCEMQFKHHTMLINTDRLKKKHEDMALDVEDLLNRLYMDKKLDVENNQRLKELWTNDFLLVSSARAASTDVPESWDELKPFIAYSIKRITSQKILIVNCDNDDTPDFEDPAGRWAILVGGQKLSRGYTIEGLTTSYFSRKPGQLDTLVQMARWYGFRKNYSDLVRLYIPETLPRGKKRQSSSKKGTKGKIKKYHLLDAFRFGAKVEEAFRNNLIQYSKDLRPEDIPPLVQYEFEDFPHDFKYLKPTAKNKMWHVTFETHYLGGVIKTVTRIGGPKSQKHNQEQLVKLLDSCSVPMSEKVLVFKDRKESVLTGLTHSQNYLQFLNDIHDSDMKPNEKQNVIKEQIEALDKMAPMPWRIIVFMPKKSEKRMSLAHYSLPNWERNYEIVNGVLKYEKPLHPPHREISAWLAKIDAGINLKSDDIKTLELQNEKCGVIYLVPFSSDKNSDLYYLWCAVYPGKGKAGAYRVIPTNQNTDHSNN